MKRSASGRTTATQRGGAGGGPSGTRVHRLGTAIRLSQRRDAGQPLQGERVAASQPFDEGVGGSVSSAIDRRRGNVSRATGGAALTSPCLPLTMRGTSRAQLAITLDPRGRSARRGCMPSGGDTEAGALGADATREEDGAVVTLRQLPQQFLGDPVFLRRFRAEAPIVAHLDGTYVVRTRAYVEDAFGMALVTDYVDGAWLRQLMATGTLRDAETALVVLRDPLL